MVVGVPAGNDRGDGSEAGPTATVQRCLDTHPMPWRHVISRAALGGWTFVQVWLFWLPHH